MFHVCVAVENQVILSQTDINYCHLLRALNETPISIATTCPPPDSSGHVRGWMVHPDHDGPVLIICPAYRKVIVCAMVSM